MVLLTCSYRSAGETLDTRTGFEISSKHDVMDITLSSCPEFIRVGYYVNIDYTEPELRETPPSPPLWEKLQRNILATNPR